MGLPFGTLVALAHLHTSHITSHFALFCRLLGRVTWDYRLERWWPLLTSILVTSLRCAYLVASVEEYVSICLELLGRCILSCQNMQ